MNLEFSSAIFNLFIMLACIMLLGGSVEIVAYYHW